MAEGGYMVTLTDMVDGQTRIHVWCGPWIKGRIDRPTDQVRRAPETHVRMAVARIVNRPASRMQRRVNDPDCYDVHLSMP